MSTFKIVLLFFTLLPVMSSHSQTTLSGTIGNMTIDSSGNPYIIADNMTVPTEKKLTIKEGVILLFKPFTGLIVEGSLIIEGSLDNPVILTTVNDTRYNPKSDLLPNPFDWNGIFITKKAAFVNISNFILEYSVYGVKSQKEEFTLSNSTFKHNGQFHVTINDEIKSVVDDIPYNYSKKRVGTGDGKPKAVHPNQTTWRTPVSIGLGVAGLAAAGAGGYFFYLTNNYTSQYNTATTQNQADEYYKKKNASLTTAIGCTIGGVVSIVSGIFIFPKNQKNSDNVTIIPLLGRQNGLTIAINY